MAAAPVCADCIGPFLWALLSASAYGVDMEPSYVCAVYFATHMTSRRPSSSSSLSRPSTSARRGLTRDAIVQRALEIGDEEGLEALSVRRLASDLGVTPMALYRHVRDKNDLYNAMLEAVMADFDLTAGIRPTMPWQRQVRRALQNAVDLLTARPVTLPLQIAYQGPLTPSIARSLEASLGILLQAGFRPRDAVALGRLVTSVVAGLLLLYRDGPRGSISQDE